MQDNFTRLNFGWLGYWLPGEKTIGTQPDQLEFVTSKAAAWDCPVSIHANPATLAKHPRTADNFEVFRRWEEVRAKKWLTDEQKQMLRNAEQEFTLLLNEKNELELVPYDQIMNVANESREVIAFTFERNKDLYAVYWHISGDKKIELPVKVRRYYPDGKSGKGNTGISIRSNRRIILFCLLVTVVILKQVNLQRMNL